MHGARCGNGEHPGADGRGTSRDSLNAGHLSAEFALCHQQHNLGQVISAPGDYCSIDDRWHCCALAYPPLSGTRPRLLDAEQRLATIEGLAGGGALRVLTSRYWYHPFLSRFIHAVHISRRLLVHTGPCSRMFIVEHDERHCKYGSGCGSGWCQQQRRSELQRRRQQRRGLVFDNRECSLRRCILCGRGLRDGGYYELSRGAHRWCRCQRRLVSDCSDCRWRNSQHGWKYFNMAGDLRSHECWWYDRALDE